ncbi:cytochrome bd-I oxidase subunit CydH [Vibrio penaeicida]
MDFDFKFALGATIVVFTVLVAFAVIAITTA